MDVTLIARDAQGADLPAPRVFDNAEMPASESALADLRATVGGADLAAPPVVLPDFHHKATMEMPSSIAVATRGHDPADADQRIRELRHGAASRWTASGRRSGVEEFYRRVRSAIRTRRGAARAFARRRRRAARSRAAGSPSSGSGSTPATSSASRRAARIDLDRYGGARPAASRVAVRSTCSSPGCGSARIGPSQPLHRAAGGRGDPRPRGRRAARASRGAAHPAVPRRRGRAHRRDRRAVRRRQALPAADARWRWRCRSRSSTWRRRAPWTQLRAAMRAVLHRWLPACRARQRRGPAADAGQRRGDELRIRVPAGDVRALRQIAADVFGGSRASSSWTRRTTRSTRRRSTASRPSCTATTRAAPSRPSGCAGIRSSRETGQAVLLPGTNRTSSYLCVAGDRRDQQPATPPATAPAPSSTSSPSAGSRRARSARPQHAAVPLQRRGAAEPRTWTTRGRRGARRSGPGWPGPAGGQHAPVRGAALRGNH